MSIAKICFRIDSMQLTLMQQSSMCYDVRILTAVLVRGPDRKVMLDKSIAVSECWQSPVDYRESVISIVSAGGYANVSVHRVD